MMKKYLRNFAFLCALLIGASSAYGQARTITGKVTDGSGAPLPGANVLVVGTKRGTVTGPQGKFSVKAEAGDKALRVSFVGFETKKVNLQSGQNNYNITLKEAGQLDEVVVTALGVERSEQALGYSVQNLNSKQIASVKPTNVSNTLSGKVAGVYVTGSSAGPTASSNVNIRGAVSLLGSNQPLYVVNGMPITNDLYSVDDGLNGSSTIDFGNAAQIVNPDDIASMNVLKGPAASALYGARAANGVILIETKTGKEQQGMGVELNSTTMFRSILKMPDFQNEYGFGGGGKYSYLDGSNYIGSNEYYEAYGENWGPRMNGQNIKQFNSNGEAVPFTPAPDNVRNFYRTGINSINNVAINNNSENGDMRFSYTRMDNEGIIPNTNLERNTVQMSLGREMWDDRFTFRANAMFVNSASDNVPNSGYDESSSVQYGWLWYPRQVEINDLRDYWAPGQEGAQQRYVENLWVNNPWFVANENTNSFESNRLIGNLRAEYQISPRLSARVRYGADVLAEQRQYRRAPSTKAVPFGSYREDEISFSETNAEALISYSSNKLDGNDIQYDIKLGGNIMRQNANYLIANNPQLQLFGTDRSIYTLTNSRSGVQSESQKTQVGINSLFGVATVSYKDFLYLDASIRNDWNSTLVSPVAGIENSDYSFLYPSISASTILSNILDFEPSSAVSFWKFKANYAEVGNGAPAYSFGRTFTPRPAFGGNAIFTTNRTAADPGLVNERTRAFEVGTDIRLWKGRLRIDATYYNMLSDNQVISLPVAASSGYDSKLTNGGSIRNQGVELLVTGVPVKTNDFTWSSTINLGHNRAIVESLPDIISGDRYSIVANMFPNDGGTAGLEFVAEEGEAYGQLYGLGFERHPETGEIIHQNGRPLHTTEKVSAGSYQPDLRIGFQNSFQYKDFSLSILFDGQIGGRIFSRSQQLYPTGGTITNDNDPNLNISTTDGRQHYSVDYNAQGEPVYSLEDAGGGVVGPGHNWNDLNGDGVFYTINDDGNKVYQMDEINGDNTTAIQPGGVGYVGYMYSYYGHGFRRDNIEAATYDATYVKLRELSIGYDLPESFTKKLGLSSARVALVGRNLLLFSQVPTIDPETYSIRGGRIIPGFESQQIFSTRQYGFSVSVKL
jgi:TonB-linked SusC/RagA family outer membrane protein